MENGHRNSGFTHRNSEYTVFFLYPLDPSGKRLHNYGKIHHYYIMGISTISKAIFNSKLLNYQRVYQNLFFKIYFLG